MKSSNVDMLSGSIGRGLLSMTIPIMIMNVMQSIFNLIDMTVLGNFTNDTAVGAVGACGVLITLCTALLIGISSGANVVVAKCLGSGDSERTQRAVGTSILFALAGGFTLLIIGVSCAKIFLGWVNCPEALMPQATIYFKIYFLGVPVSMLYNFGASILRAAGDTKRPMYFLMIGGVIKIIMNIFFITVCNMTVEGVAIATIIANTIACCLVYMVIIQSRDRINFNFKRLRFYGTELKEILFIGIPTGVQSGLYSLANAVITSAVNSFGADATTGVSIANQFDSILYQISHAPSLAVIPYVAQNVGAKNYERVKKATIKAILITVAFGGSLGMLSALFSSQLSGIMSSTPAVIEYSCQKMVIISSTYFICGINEVMGGVLRGLGRPVIPTVTTFIFMCVLRFIWVYAIFPLLPNLTFLYLVWPIGWILSIIVHVIAYYYTMKKLNQCEENLMQITK